MTTTRSLLPTRRAPSTPGETLRHEFLEPTGMTVVELSKRSGVDRNTLQLILAGARDVTRTTSIRLGKALGTSEGFFLGLQHALDLWGIRHREGPALAAFALRSEARRSPAHGPAKRARTLAFSRKLARVGSRRAKPSGGRRPNLSLAPTLPGCPIDRKSSEFTPSKVSL